ncbi:MAG: amidohydrolase family protein [Dehalococcoidia bacterium]|nr:amidohydrolase family protein [Dehalococcoidia bacterium]
MIVDAFTHIIPSSYLEKLSSTSGEAVKKRVDHCRALIRERPHATDIGRRLELLKKHNIDCQVVTLMHTIDCNVLPFPLERQLEMAQAINDGMARVMEQSKGKLVGIGAVPLNLLEAGGLKEMERAIKVLGLRGFGIASNSRGKPVDAPEFAPFWARAEEMGVPVFIHPADPQGQNDRPYEAQYNMTLVWGWPFETVLMLSRLVFSGIMEKHPRLNVVSHHLGGGMVPFLYGRIEESYTREAQQRVLGRELTRPLKELFGRFYYDTAGGSTEAAIKCCYDIFGADRILLATDAPHGPEGGEPALKDFPRRVRESGIPKAAVDKILGGNAQKLLGIG